MELLVGFVIALGIILAILELALRSAQGAQRTIDPLSGPHPDEAPLSDSFARDRARLDAHAASRARSSRDWRDVRLTFESPTLNFHDGWRSTTDAPVTPTRRIHLYGGSTMLCLEVPDGETIASQLQRRVADRLPPVEVLNRGISGATVAGNRDTLVDDEIQSGDVVIVHFGVNDAKLNAYHQRGRGPFGFLPGWVSVLGFLRLRLGLRIAQWLWLETVTMDERRQRATAGARARAVLVALRDIERRVRDRGAVMCATLQPHIWCKSPSTQELRLRQRMASTTPIALGVSYDAFRETLHDQPWFVDLSDAFAQSPDTLLTDWAHTNAAGNAVIAAAFADLYDAAVAARYPS